MTLNGHVLTESQKETLFLALILAGNAIMSPESKAPMELRNEQIDNLAELSDMMDNPIGD